MLYFKMFWTFPLVCSIFLSTGVSAFQMHVPNSWNCGFNYQTPHFYNDYHITSFGFCFEDPSVFCKQHAVLMNPCKKHRNMGLYCCMMEDINERYFQNKYKDVKSRFWLSERNFLLMAGDTPRNRRMYKFILMDMDYAKFTNKEEMSIFLTLIIADTHYLTNMEEHLPIDIAVNVTKHGHKEEVKFIGRGAIHVRGSKYYEWISGELNKVLEEHGNVNATTSKLINGLVAPEVLFFPTIAFRAAVLLWRKSFSYVNQKPMGDLYKRLSDGKIESLAEIVYHLKGNIEQLPYIANIWKRVRKILNIHNPITEEQHSFLGLVCKYSEFCRAQIVEVKEAIEKDKKMDRCNPNPDRKAVKKLCLDCTQDLFVFLIFDPMFLTNRVNDENIQKLVQDINDNTSESHVHIAYAVEETRYGISEITSATNLHQYAGLQLVRQFQISELLNFTVNTIKKIRRQKLEARSSCKYVVALITEKLSLSSQYVRNQIAAAEEDGINLYHLYTNHHGTLDEKLSISALSRQLNLQRNDIIERMCNDPKIIKVGSFGTLQLGKFEKRSFVIRVGKHEKQILILMKTLKGRMDHIEISRMDWFLPFDGSYNSTISIKKSFRIEDSYFRFIGDGLTVRIYNSKDHKVYSYKPASHEIHLLLEGKETANVIDFQVISETKLILKLFATEQKVKEHLRYVRVSCIFSTILLVLVLGIYLPNARALLCNILQCFRKMIGKPEEYMVQGNKNCRWCYRRLSDDKAYYKLYNRDNGNAGGTEIFRRNSFLTVPSPQHLRGDKCSYCRTTVESNLITFIHFLRIVILVIFEAVIATSIKKTDSEALCCFWSGVILFSLQAIFLSALGEILCYFALSRVVGNWKWWLLNTSACILFTFSIEHTRNQPRQSCWPFADTYHGYIAGAEVLLIATVFFLVTLYFYVKHGHTKSKEKLYILTLMLITSLLIIVGFLATYCARNFLMLSAILGFGALNCLTMTFVAILAVSVQIQARNWLSSASKLDKEEKSRRTSQNSRPVSMDGYLLPNPQVAQMESSARKSEFIMTENGHRDIVNQPIKSVSIVPTQTSQRHPSSDTAEALHPISLPNYAIKSVLCSSDSSMSSQADDEFNFDDKFQIIVRARRPRSSSELIQTKQLISPTHKSSLIQHHSAEIYSPKSNKETNTENGSDDSFCISKFVTNAPPVIQIHHDVDK